MDTHVGKLIDSVGSIFRGSDVLPWCDPDIIAGFESEVAEAANEEQKTESLMRLSWALVHSRQPEDVNRGIGMLEASLDRSSSPEETREKLYLLAVGRYRTGDYTRSRQLLERCLEIQHDWRQAITLQRLVEEKTKRDGMIGMAIITGAFGVVGLVAGGIIAAASSSSRKR
ncbi:Mitochondrial fission 1 protein A [Zea mays]|uniref:Mitochondrial fission 1 protein n=2 Tax=Zea mays TaxID=4577 RepID=B6TRK0_MAIZE|nr:mitochondria fission 1 protein [Zea mays]ACG39733.1 mitochondria fission 1 protein [Zea mays]AQL06567.1 Mitochondria fission 1 protein [Zea mays]PWZ06594.1 Mitochondrial fission 1 protein A [Zea mays]|eukprot:NP_001150606.1 mitochondria fission 1 protein [Zea mays]